MSQPLGRRVVWLSLVVVLVATGVGATVLATGGTLGQALVASLLAGLFTVVVAPLAVIARQVGSVADDPRTLERRLGTAAGRSQSELDALDEWDERRGRLDRYRDDE